MENLFANKHGHIDVDVNDFSMIDLTPERVREITLGGMITSGPGLDVKYMPTQYELETVVTMMQHAITRGQMIDFGYWPNEMIKATSKRGGKLYAQGALAHPFSSPYVIVHRWDDHTDEREMRYARDLKRSYPMTSVYLVNPFPDSGVGTCCDFEAMELEGFRVHKDNVLGIGDRIGYSAINSIGTDKYHLNVIPTLYRFNSLRDNPKFGKMMDQYDGSNPVEMAAANVIDPIITAMVLLSTRGMKSKTVSVKDSLNKARQAKGKPIIPPYQRIDSKPYVTAIMSRQQRSHDRASLGGTHASPIVHLRIGYWRNYQSGERSFIRDTLVNATDEMRNAFIANRSHYVVKES